MMSEKNVYDYVIVGAGSAGCVLANRLSEDPAVRVCILEAGGRDSDPLIRIPIGIGKMHEKRLHDWGYDSEPEPGLDNRKIEAMRGKVIGGSSSINVMAHVRGNAGDYDRWAQKGCTGWSYAAVLPYFRRSERWEGGEDAWRGGGGPLDVISSKSTDPLFDAWFEAARQAGYPITEDYNGASQEGFGRSQSTIRNGRRCSAATAFLHPALTRSNLTLVTNALATKIVLEGTRATGVEFAHGNDGRTSVVRAEREVILSGGVFNSPQLLMLSGIGPADHLRDVDIDPVIDLPGVGGNLQDHLAVMVAYDRPEGGPFRDLMRFDRMAVAMVRAHLFGSGPATVLPSGLHGFIKTRPELAVPDIQFLFRGTAGNAHLWFPGVKAPYRDAFGIRPVLLHPESRGTVRLRDADPRTPVRIVQNFFDVEDDIGTLRQGVRLAREVAGQPALAPFRGEETAPGKSAVSDGDIDAWIRRTAITAHHPSCSCPMGIGADAVLDAELRVRGADGLRVVDAAAMPDLVSGNINACVLMIAEKALDLIRNKTAARAASESRTAISRPS
jgi:4-pyridoxate dehydrogenase